MKIDDLRGDTPEIRSQRMRALRLAVSLDVSLPNSQEAFAAWLGLSDRRVWNNYERRGSPPSRAATTLITQKTGAPMGWVHAGDPAGMAYDLKERLEMVLSDPALAEDRLTQGPAAGAPQARRAGF